MGFPIKFDLVRGHGTQPQSGPPPTRPPSCYRETAATQSQQKTGFAGARATPLVIGEGLGTLAKQAVDPHRAIAEQQQHKAKEKHGGEHGLRH